MSRRERIVQTCTQVEGNYLEVNPLSWLGKPTGEQSMVGKAESLRIKVLATQRQDLMDMDKAEVYCLKSSDEVGISVTGAEALMTTLVIGREFVA